MFSEACPPARNRRQLNPGTPLLLLSLAGMLISLASLTACAVGNSASMLSAPPSSSSSPANVKVSGNLPAAQTGVAYSGAVTVTGGSGPYTFSLSWGSLPAGLTLNTSTGVISGTASQSGTFGFGVHVVDASDAGGASSFSMAVVPAPLVTVTITPATDSIYSGTTIQFSAQVANTSNTTVIWTAAPGTISSSGLYTAPSVTSTTNAVVTAISVAQISAFAAAAVTVTPPVAVSVTPAVTSLSSAATMQFTAQVANSSNLAVTWTAAPGTISSGGLYTAPSVNTSTPAVVTATSVAQTSAFAAAAVTVTPSVTVSVTPSSGSVSSAATLQFTAQVTNTSNPAVTWSASPGTISSGGLYTAPSVTSTTSAVVTATSVAQKSASATASLSVTPAVTVSVTPSIDTIGSANTIQFSALVSNASNTAVTWSAAPGTISSRGLYTAPTVASNTSAVVTATSVALSTAHATAAVTVTPPPAPPLSVSTSSLPNATSGSAYTDSLSATGGTAPYTWSLTTGSLPMGLSVQSSGSLAGTTSQAGAYTFTVNVSDSSSPKQTASEPLTLTVAVTSTGPPPPTTFMGFSESDTASDNWPSQNYAMQRFWDSEPDQWPGLNTAAGVYTWTNLDDDLALAYSSGTMIALYTLARTPPWATSNPNDSSCNYSTGAGNGPGECDAPYDLNSDGSGTNATWKAWITAIASHANDPTYLQSHAHIKYWEIWNEPDTKAFWAGSIAQLARLTEDANCIITGRGVIHESGNGTATNCTATAIDATAQIVMASAHAKGAALTYGQNELYCNNTSGIPTYQLPCPNPANAIATAIDIVNFHMKPGNESGNNCPAPTPCTPESAMQWYISNIKGMLQPAELTKPLWDGEAQYSSGGFTGNYVDSDMAASFMPRFYLEDWTLGLSGMAWYYATSEVEPASAGTSYQQTYNWLVNASLSTPCAATGTVWSCGITLSGKQYQIMWDTSQSCANGTCTTKEQPVGTQWTLYQDMTSASNTISVSGNSVPVGIKAVVLSY